MDVLCRAALNGIIRERRSLVRLRLLSPCAIEADMIDSVATLLFLTKNGQDSDKNCRRAATDSTEKRQEERPQTPMTKIVRPDFVMDHDLDS